MKRFFVDPEVVEGSLRTPHNLSEAWDEVAKFGESVQLLGEPPESRPMNYTDEEISYIREEAKRLFVQQTNHLPRPSGQLRRFVLSAGAPGAGKTTLLEKLLETDPAMQGLVFCDPDERALKLMDAYLKDVALYSKTRSEIVATALAYAKWRAASQWISNTMMNRACDEGYNILLGTTATSKFMPVLYGNARNAGYVSETFVVCAPQDVRFKSAFRRSVTEGAKYTTAKDIEEKGIEFYERLPDLLRDTDQLQLYWRNQVEAYPSLVATSTRRGEINVINQEGLNAIIEDMALVKPGFSFDTLFRPRREHSPPQPSPHI